MSYTDEIAKVSRKPITIVELVLDYCDNAWGVSPCTPFPGTTYCYNTYCTCVDSPMGLVIDKYNYTNTTGKTYKFCEKNAPLPEMLYKPYVVSISELPTKISIGDKITRRVTVKFLDEPDVYIDEDPYYELRSGFVSVGTNRGTYFRKLFKRNPNYYNRYIYIKSGFEGMNVSDYKLIFQGKIKNVKINYNEVSIEAAEEFDYLSTKLTSFKATLAANIIYTDTSITITTDDVIPQSSTYGNEKFTFSHIKIDNEYMYVTAYNQYTYTFTVERGKINSYAVSHTAGAEVHAVWAKCEDPFLTIMDIADAVGYDVDVNIFIYYSGVGCSVGTVIIDGGVSALTLINELCELTNSKCYLKYNEYNELKFTIVQMNYYSERPLGYPPFITDCVQLSESDIIKGSMSIDFDPTSRYDKFSLYYNIPIGSGIDKDNATISSINYNTNKIEEYEGESGVNVERVIVTRWMNDYNQYINPYRLNSTLSYYNAWIAMFVPLNLASYADPKRIISCDIELKSDSIEIGDFVKLTTDYQLQDYDGGPIEDAYYQVIEKSRQNNRLKLKLEEQISLE